jgi:hypothetical protein
MRTFVYLREFGAAATVCGHTESVKLKADTAARLQEFPPQGREPEAAFGVRHFLFWLGRLTYTSPRLRLQTNSASHRCLNACGGGRESCRADDGSVQSRGACHAASGSALSSLLKGGISPLERSPKRVAYNGDAHVDRNRLVLDAAAGRRPRPDHRFGGNGSVSGAQTGVLDRTQQQLSPRALIWVHRFV